MAIPEGLEPPYSDYSVNDRLEGGTDTGPISLHIYLNEPRK